MSEKINLYLIAFLAEEPLISRVRFIQQVIAERFNSKAALKPPVHITTVPSFKTTSDLEERLKVALTQFIAQYESFTLQLNGFGSFERNNVIFIHPEPHEYLKKFYKDFGEFLRDKLKFEKKLAKLSFSPHITVAYRDMTKEMFDMAWPKFKDKEFKDEIVVKSMFLLRHSGKEWIPIIEFPFKQSQQNF